MANLRRLRLRSVVAVLLVGLGCRTSATQGVNAQRFPPRVTKADPPPARSAAPTSAEPDDDRAVTDAWKAIGCFVGGPWSEALGAIAEERALADLARCREVETTLLDAPPSDVKTLEALRAVEPAAVTRVVAGFRRVGAKLPAKRRDGLAALIEASAVAAREAQAARKVAQPLRVKGSKPTEEQLGALAPHAGLDALFAIEGEESRLVALTLAADRLETARGMAPRAQLAVAAPALQRTFGVSPAAAADDDGLQAWLSLLAGAAKAGGHPAVIPDGADDRARERACRLALATAVADRFEALAKKLPKGPALDVAGGYARILRERIVDAQEKDKAQTKADSLGPAASASASASAKASGKPTPKK